MNHSSIVCFGAGNLGRRLARVVRPLLFCDNNPALWNTQIDGVPVHSPKAAVDRYPDATFVVAIWNPSRTETMLHRLEFLKALGASNVVPFTGFLADYGSVLAPHMLWEQPSYYAARQGEIARARGLFDEEGRQEFDRQMRLRSGDFSDQIINQGTQYFPEGFLRLGQHETFVDCGAYDGDTIAQFREATGDRFDRIVAFEPDPANFAALKSAVNDDCRITLRPSATGARRETLRFNDGNGVASRISSNGTYDVQVITLDEALDGIAPTYMKFDIEGSEADALDGGRNTIVRHRPKMAVCVYHLPDHLWSIPLRLDELLPDSRFTLRTYASDGFECVCYCVPR